MNGEEFYIFYIYYLLTVFRNQLLIANLQFQKFHTQKF